MEILLVLVIDQQYPKINICHKARKLYIVDIDKLVRGNVKVESAVPSFSN